VTSKTHWVALIFAVEVERSSAIIACPEKMSAIGWFRRDALPSPLHSFFLENLAFAGPHIPGLSRP